MPPSRTRYEKSLLETKTRWKSRLETTTDGPVAWSLHPSGPILAQPSAELSDARIGKRVSGNHPRAGRVSGFVLPDDVPGLAVEVQADGNGLRLGVADARPQHRRFFGRVHARCA